MQDLVPTPSGDSLCRLLQLMGIGDEGETWRLGPTILFCSYVSLSFTFDTTSDGSLLGLVFILLDRYVLMTSRFWEGFL